MTKKDLQLIKRFLTGTFAVLLVLLGILSFGIGSSLWQTPDLVLEAQSANESGRQPAALPPQETSAVFAKLPLVSEGSAQKAIVKDTTLTLDLGCQLAPLQPVPASIQGQVRLRLQKCAVSSGDQAFRVENRTTGYQASVFPTQKTTLSTEYIQIQKGINEISLELTAANGKVVTSTLQLMGL